MDERVWVWWIRPILLGIGLFVSVMIVAGIARVISYWQTTYPVPDQNFSSTRRTKTPPMGWNSWNTFGCSADLNEKNIKEVVDAMVSKGLVAAGYRYVVIDDCWQGIRTTDGQLVADTVRFPSGMKAMSDYIHAKGLKFGLYTSAGKISCEKRPGSYGYEVSDSSTFAEWGVDFLKLDWCGVENLDVHVVLQTWQKLLTKNNSAPVVSLTVTQPANQLNDQIWLWGAAVGDMWRTTSDLENNWHDMLRVFDVHSAFAPYQRVGAWNDADTLLVGRDKLNLTEQQTHLSLWAMMSTPLFLGSDPRALSAESIAMLTNRDVLRVNQDALGFQGEVVWQQAEVEIISKPLMNRGSRAVLILNRGEQLNTVHLDPSVVGLGSNLLIKDVWAQNGWWPHYGRQVFTLYGHEAKLLLLKGIDLQDSTETFNPDLTSPVTVGNLTKQVAASSQGVFEYDSFLRAGVGLGVKSRSSFRYHLNQNCSRFTGEFEYVGRGEKLGFEAGKGMIIEVFADGKQLAQQQVSVEVTKIAFDLPISGTRVLDLVTRPTAGSYSTVQYGRWIHPNVICSN